MFSLAWTFKDRVLFVSELLPVDIIKPLKSFKLG